MRKTIYRGNAEALCALTLDGLREILPALGAVKVFDERVGVVNNVQIWGFRDDYGTALIAKTYMGESKRQGSLFQLGTTQLSLELTSEDETKFGEVEKLVLDSKAQHEKDKLERWQKRLPKFPDIKK